MKVLHLLQSGSFSGAENVVCQIFGMLKNESDIEMVYCSSEGPIKEALAERGIRYIPLKNFTVDAIRTAISNEKPDVIHAHDMRASFYAAKACGRIPLVSHVHNNNFNSRGISPKSIAYMYAAMKARHIFWVSQSSFDGYAFHGFFKNKSTVLYNIIDIKDLYAKMQPDSCKYEYDVVYVGRLTYQKDPLRLMKVLRLAIDKKPDIKIAIVGSGDMEEETKRCAINYGITDNVDFLGFQSNPLIIIHDSKAMIMTSRWEGTPMCALEALALGVPIVSTPADGLRDLIESGSTGYLFEDDAQLAESLVSLANDHEKQEKMSKNAYEFSLHYNDMQKYRSQILKVYHQL